MTGYEGFIKSRRIDDEKEVQKAMYEQREYLKLKDKCYEAIVNPSITVPPCDWTKVTRFCMMELADFMRELGFTDDDEIRKFMKETRQAIKERANEEAEE